MTEMPSPLIETSSALAIHALWRARILSTEPVDHLRARSAVERLYKTLNISLPKAVIIVPSPIQAILVLRALTMAGYIKGYDQNLKSANGALTALLEAAPRGGVGTAVQNFAEQLVAMPVSRALSEHHLFEADKYQRAAAVSIIREQTGFDVLPRLTQKGRRPEAWEPTNLAACIAAVAQLDFWRRTFSGFLTASPTPVMRALDKVCQTCGWSILLESFAVVSDRPAALKLRSLELGGTSDGLLHSYRDGFQIRARQGLILPAWLSASPHRVTVRHVESETNVEMRRVLLEAMGAEQYLRKSRAKKLHQDETGILWQRTLSPREQEWRPLLQPITFVEVVNGTAETDGTFKRYFLRVPPWVTSAREGVAWTYGLTAGDYRPQLRT